MLGLDVAGERHLGEERLSLLDVDRAERAIEIDHGERKLRAGMALGGGLLEPLRGLRHIRGDAAARLVGCAHHRHGAGIARVGHGPGDRQRASVVLVLEQRNRFLENWVSRSLGRERQEEAGANRQSTEHLPLPTCCRQAG